MSPSIPVPSVAHATGFRDDGVTDAPDLVMGPRSRATRDAVIRRAKQELADRGI